jgi:geranylgeranyl reductase family protein
MNHSLADLPDACDVLVVGAGPAGSAAAIVLARAGVDIRLIDQHSFPRDKTCGDALIADSHAAFVALGVHEQVMAQAHPVSHLGFIGPRGGCLEIASTLAVLPRLKLDHLLCQAAVAAGAGMHAPVRFEGPLTDATGQVIGARLRQGDAQREVRARTVILATGAMPQALIAAGLCTRRAPSGVALRAYVSHPEMARRMQRIEVIWHPRLRHGYGWVFPAPGGLFNIGVGVFHEHGEGTRNKVNLHERFEALREVHPVARELLADGVMQGDMKGAPLRCTLDGAQHACPGLLVAGEAAGSTYLLTGEGIGKAMETGMLAAQAVLAQRAGTLGSTPLHEDYTRRLAELKPRFAVYAQANRVNEHPWLADLVIWRGNRSARLRQRMGRVLNETSQPGNLLSWKGARRLLFG